MTKKNNDWKMTQKIERVLASLERQIKTLRLGIKGLCELNRSALIKLERRLDKLEQGD